MFDVPSASASFNFGSTTAAPAAAHNMFGAPATSTFSFGASPPATTSFGLVPTAPAQTPSAFGAPGASPFGTSSFGFGSTATAPSQPSNIFGAPATTFSIPTASSFGAAPATTPFGLNVGATPVASAIGSADSQITMNTRFTQLPDAYRNVIEQTNTEYKKTMREGLDEIARFQPKLLDELRAELGRTSLAALKLGNQQDILLGEIRLFHDKAKDNLRDVRKYGASGLQQIQNRGGLNTRTYLMSEELPTIFYLDAASRIENRLVSIIEEVQSISRQLLATIGLMSGEEGQYGQQTRIGPQHLIKLIQRQSEAFARVAASVAEVHSQADDMRASYRRIYCYDDGQPQGSNRSRLDPFAEADRAVAANQRLMSKKFRAEEFNRAHAAASTALPQTAATPAPSPYNFSLPANTAAGPASGGSFGLGGFGNSFGGVAPSTTPNLGAASPFGAVSGFGGFGTPASGFGTPAGGFGGSGFKALDLATTGPTLGFGGVPAPTSAAFGTSFGTGSTSSRKSGSKSRK